MKTNSTPTPKMDSFDREAILAAGFEDLGITTTGMPSLGKLQKLSHELGQAIQNITAFRIDWRPCDGPNSSPAHQGTWALFLKPKSKRNLMGPEGKTSGLMGHGTLLQTATYTN